MTVSSPWVSPPRAAYLHHERHRGITSESGLGPCKAIVRLFVDEVTVLTTEGLGERFDSERVPLIALYFDYGGRIYPCASSDDLPERDLAKEREARRVLENLGAMDLACLEETHAVSPDVTADYLVRLEGSVHDYCGFAAYVVPQLQRLGFRVDVADDYPYKVVAEETQWYAETKTDEKKPCWFSLELGVELNGRRVSFLPALLELLEQSRDKDDLASLVKSSSKCVALPVGEGTYLPVPIERVRGLVRVLSELWDGKGLRTGGQLSAPLLRANALDLLDTIITEAGGVVTIDDETAAHAAHCAPVRKAIPAPDGLQAELRSYQYDGISFLASLAAREEGGVLADDMGLGKTLQTIAHLLREKNSGHLAKHPALIVSPTSLVFNWSREMSKFAPQLKVVTHAGPQRHGNVFEGADVVVTSYPVLLRDIDRFGEEGQTFRVLVMDEAQAIKNDSSRVHKATKAVNAAYKIALSGTPIENHTGELWALFDVVNPGLLGDCSGFNRNFRVPIEKYRNVDRLAALRHLVAPYMLRRQKSDVLKDLPPKTELFRPVELAGGQRELYESIRVAAHQEVRKIIKRKGLSASTIPILTALTKLRQVCCDPRLSSLGAASRVRESAKGEMFFDMVGKQLGSGHRILVFSQFTSMLALLAKGLNDRDIRYSLLTGATKDRAAVCDEFEGGATPIFLISLKAGGTGLTLTSADTVIHYDPWWNPAVQSQATDRAYRIGQKKPVFVHNLFAAGSVEERMLHLQKRKRSMARAILDADSDASVFSEDDVEVLFAPLSA